MSSVTVIVPARDAAATIEATLRALEAQTESAEVIVVDNGSDDDTAQLARSSPVDPTVIELPRGAGPGRARNEGARAASGELLAFTDADCEPEPGWVRAGIERAAGADLIQGRVRPAAPRGPFDRTVDVGVETTLYETANLFVTKEAFERAGGFGQFSAPREAPFGEDVVFGWRCRRAGSRAVFAPEAVVRHAVFARGPWGYVRERWRRRHFPALVREVPELRRTFLYRRFFLNTRSAAADLAVVAIAAAVAVSPFAALGAVPYAVSVGAAALRWRRRAPIVALVEPVADAVGLVAVLVGSARSRTVVL